MQSKSLTMQDIIQSSCSLLDRGEFLLNNDFGCNFSGKCSNCELHELGYLHQTYCLNAVILFTYIIVTVVCSFTGKGLKGDSIICYRCGSKALRQLAYHYRKNIPANELPGIL